GPQQIAITDAAHPLRACKMAVMDCTRAFRFACGVKTEENLDDLAPVSPLLRRIEQPEVGPEMPLVVSSDLRKIRRTVVKSGNGHGFCPLSRLERFPMSFVSRR